MHCNVLKEWAKVVEVARECTVLFNNIDIGSLLVNSNITLIIRGYFDYACLALAKVLHIPCAAGSSYGRKRILTHSLEIKVGHGLLSTSTGKWVVHLSVI